MTIHAKDRDTLQATPGRFVSVLGSVAFLGVCFTIATLIFIFDPKDESRTWTSILVVLLFTLVAAVTAWLNRVPSLDRTILAVLGTLYSGAAVSVYIVVSSYLLTRADPIAWDQVSFHQYLWVFFWFSTIAAALANGFVSTDRNRRFGYFLAICSLLLLAGIFVKYSILRFALLKETLTSEVIAFAVGAGLFVVSYIGALEAEERKARKAQS